MTVRPAPHVLDKLEPQLAWWRKQMVGNEGKGPIALGEIVSEESECPDDEITLDELDSLIAAAKQADNLREALREVLGIARAVSHDGAYVAFERADALLAASPAAEDER